MRWSISFVYIEIFVVHDANDTIPPIRRYIYQKLRRSCACMHSQCQLVQFPGKDRTSLSDKIQSEEQELVKDIIIKPSNTWETYHSSINQTCFLSILNRIYFLLFEFQDSNICIINKGHRQNKALTIINKCIIKHEDTMCRV